MTLLEVVLAMWVLFVSIVLATAVMDRSMKNMRKSEHTTRAAFLAQEKMTETVALSPRHIHPGGGSFAPPFDSYTWRLRVGTQPDGFRLLSVTVDGPADAEFTLYTERRAAPRVVWFTSNRDGVSQLYRIQDDGRELERMTHTQYAENQASISPDNRVAFVSDRAGHNQILELDPDTGKQFLLVADKSQEPAWSPDGKHLAYTGYDQGYSQIFVTNVETGQSTNLTQAFQHASGPTWSPDGQSIAYVVQTTGGSQIESIQVDTADRHPLTPASGWNTSPAFSPDGKTLLFMSNRDGNPDLYAMDVASGSVNRLTRDPAYDSGGRYSPDGKKIVFWSERSGVAELYEMNPDGNGVQKLITKAGPMFRPYFEKDACWEP